MSAYLIWMNKTTFLPDSKHFTVDYYKQKRSKQWMILLILLFD